MKNEITQIPMIIEQQTALGTNALLNPGKYNGFMGISIQHKFFAPKRMQYYIEWGSKVFKNFAIVLMDDPDRYNFEVFNSLNADEALTKARNISDEKKRSYEKLITALQTDNVRILQFRDFADNEEYKNILRQLKEFSVSDQSFHGDLRNLMRMGIGGKLKEMQESRNIPDSEMRDTIEVLLNYAIEELASIIYFTEYGYPIEVDPTIEFTTKTYLYDNNFPRISQSLALTNRGHIYAHPECAKKDTY
ncbi:MAG: tRNA-dependent cyclodipeptide synthase [Candidatus Dojkabacteria bacterium]|nr:MAG: tRNA-dependent cyclodipeptide synthase [Candidatus Dojkabacteria bacterium]